MCAEKESALQALAHIDAYCKSMLGAPAAASMAGGAMYVRACTSWIAVSGRYDSFMVTADCQAGNGSGARVSRAAQQAATPFDV